jgi:hypothetical protein
MPTYRLHSTDGNDLGILEHPAPNLEAGDVVILPDGREARVTAAIGAGRGSKFAALLEVVLCGETDRDLV